MPTPRSSYKEEPQGLYAAHYIDLLLSLLSERRVQLNPVVAEVESISSFVSYDGDFPYFLCTYLNLQIAWLCLHIPEDHNLWTFVMF